MRTARTRFTIAAGLLLLATGITWAAKDPVFTSRGGAIRGYDPVAYFEAGQPQKGDKRFTYQWQGAEWRFVSAERRDRFAAHPEKFAPQYGGYCAWAISQGYTASTDPAAWAIVDGKLYLNYDDKVKTKWQRNRADHIVAADANWPAVLK